MSRIVCAILWSALLACAQTPQLLPAGVSLTVRLETTLDSEKAALDDPVTATVIKDAKYKGKVIVPAKATLRGHLRFLDRKSTQVALGIQFTELEFSSTKTRVLLELDRVITLLPGEKRMDLGSLDRSSRPEAGSEAPTTIINEPRGTGIFIVQRQRFKLARLEMVWRTLPPE